MTSPVFALILAAGRGTRLGPAASIRPKCLTMVAGRSIIDRQMEALRMVGVQAIVVVTGFAEALLKSEAKSLADRHGLGVRFVHNERFAETNVLASWSIGAERIETDYIYLHGDTVIEPLFLERLAGAASSGSFTLAIDRHQCGEEEMKVRLRDGLVVDISKTIPSMQADAEFSGILHCPSSLRARLRSCADEILASPKGQASFFEAALKAGIETQAFRCQPCDVTGTRWREIDFPEDLVAAEELFSQ